MSCYERVKGVNTVPALLSGSYIYIYTYKYSQPYVYHPSILEREGGANKEGDKKKIRRIRLLDLRVTMYTHSYAVVVEGTFVHSMGNGEGLGIEFI